MRVALTLLAAGVLAACGGTSAPPPDADGTDDGACAAAPPALDAALEVGPPADGPAGFCGGAIELAGVTPFGPFEPTALSTEIASAPRALRITLAEEPPSGIQLTFDVPADTTGAFGGPQDVAGFVESGGVVMPIMVHVDITSAAGTAPGDAGGSAPGEVRMDLTITTDCGSFSGSLVASVCGVAA
jgi:hypothetical protein